MLRSGRDTFNSTIAVTLPQRAASICSPTPSAWWSPPSPRAFLQLLQAPHLCGRMHEKFNNFFFLEMDGGLQMHSPSFLNDDLLKVDKIGREQSLDKYI